mmetsp:Transcript_44111/g.172067  ORF Transcript_44111/g.172067 Transcript_44111/m.172067 type:complete len:274 (-) Transcript_44111:331-1152(-)
MPRVQRVLFERPRVVSVETVAIPEPGSSEVSVQVVYSAVSAGTELLAYRGEMPNDLSADEVLKDFSEPFRYPSSFGYCTAGHVDAIGDGVPRDWLGKKVFAFKGHASSYVCDPSELIPIPEDIELKDAVMFPSVETAVTLVMDAHPRLGDSVAVIGQGVVGLLAAKIISEYYPMSRLVTADLYTMRQERSSSYTGTVLAAGSTTAEAKMRLREAATNSEFTGADIVSSDPRSGKHLIDHCDLKLKHAYLLAAVSPSRRLKLVGVALALKLQLT